MISIDICEDHKLFVEMLEKFFSGRRDIILKDKAYDGEGCRKMLLFARPDVLLLDIGLPDINGLELCSELKSKYPSLKIIMLTTYSEIIIVKKAMNNGASGYILKSSTTEEILEGINSVVNGNVFMCDEVNVMLKKNDNNSVALTKREIQLLKLIVDGYTNDEISDKMCLAPITIKGYRKNLVFKLNVHNTAQLVKKAIEEKLVML